MTEKITIIKYKCQICGEMYDSESGADECEKKPITHDKGVKKGDKVLILTGDGEGNTGTVEKVRVVSKYWGHYRWERYWHTIQVIAKVDGGYGSRTLTFDDYEVFNEQK